MFKGQGMYKRSQGCQVVKPDLEPGNVVCMPKALFLAILLCQVRNALRLREKDACFPHHGSLTQQREGQHLFTVVIFLTHKGRSRLVQVYTF